jgi:hypothetical protein
MSSTENKKNQQSESLPDHFLDKLEMESSVKPVESLDLK